MKYVKMFLLAVLAGVAIAIGGVVFLSVENRVVGAVLFSVGLYAVCAHGLNLFTGKVGYLVNEKPKYLLDLLIIWLGNLVGTVLAGCAVLLTRVSTISQRASEMCATKTQDNLLSLLVLGVFCGLLMYIAVEGYKVVNNPLILVACVTAFILCGFEHCIANMFYFTVAKAWSGRTVVCTLVVTLGNSLGGVLIPLVKKIKTKE